MQASQGGREEQAHAYHAADDEHGLDAGGRAADEAAQPVPHDAAEEDVVGPVRAPGADGFDGEVVDAPHDGHEDEQTENSVREQGVHPAGEVAAGRGFLDDGGEEGLDGIVAAAGDERDGVVAAGFLQVQAQGVDGVRLLVVQAGGFLRVALQQKQGAAAVAEGELPHAREGFLQLRAQVQGLGGLGQGGHHQASQLRQAGLFQGADRYHGAAEGLRQRGGVYLVPALLGQVDHVQRDDDGDAGFDELAREVQVALGVRGVHHVDDEVRLAFRQVLPRDHLLRGVGGEGVDAGEVDELRFRMLAQGAGFLLDGHPGPVAHVLVAACQFIEEGGLAAVRVACQCYVHGCVSVSVFCLDHRGLRAPKGKRKPAQRYLQRVPQGCNFQ